MERLPLSGSERQANPLDVFSSKAAFVPKNKKTVTERDAEVCLNLVEALDDHDDVQNVFSDFDINMLRDCCPEQNGGHSAERIATVCEEVLDRKDVLIPVSVSFKRPASWQKAVQA